jgi:L-alanine-DL-glutamate epimerase-like enolase superfamily enzyme
MRIVNVCTRLYRIPLTRPLENALFTYTAFEYVITEVQADDGVCGTGWVYTVGAGGSAVKATIDDYLAAHLLGRPALQTVEIHSELRRLLSPVAGVTSSLAVAAIDIALWDLKAKVADLPLYQLLGGARDHVAICASGIDLNYSMSELVEEVDQWVDQGYAAAKVKVGKPTISEDVARLEAVRERLPDGFTLLVDAQQGWSVGEACRRVRAFEPLAIGFLEDPLPISDVAGYRQLRARSAIPIAGGETLSSVAAFDPLIAGEGLDVVRNDVCRLSGITEWLRVAHLAEAYHLVSAPHFVEEISIQLACAVAAVHSIEHVPLIRLVNAGVVADASPVTAGHVAPPPATGHGIVFDHERLTHFAA